LDELTKQVLVTENLTLLKPEQGRTTKMVLVVIRVYNVRGEILQI
jgi:hypothetical protein